MGPEDATPTTSPVAPDRAPADGVAPDRSGRDGAAPDPTAPDPSTPDRSTHDRPRINLRGIVREELERRLEAAVHFPDDNPNPVLRMDGRGTLIYANPASRPIVVALGASLGAPIPEPWLGQLLAALASPERTPVEVDAGNRCYSILPVAISEWDFVNLYGTDVTAARVVARFPDRNPNPVLRLSEDGRLVYFNAASEPIISALGLVLGDPLPDHLAAPLLADADASPAQPLEVRGGGRWFELTPVRVPEFGFINLYGADVTGMRAITRFPGQNPNPVMRVSRDGRLLYANPASRVITVGLGLEIGQRLPPELLADVRGEVGPAGSRAFELATGGQVFEMVAVPVFEFDFINLYATDVTAARELEVAHRENERLLLNILPAPIALRLRQGERIIADRHEELSLLFADVVGFTQLASRLEAAEVVDLLNDLFTHMDRLVDDHGLEKIKTIGDAYMVVGGLPPRDDDHLARLADMALELTASLARRPDRPLHVRVGLHVGPAVAGVIGAKRFIYDVWGDTVNTASRLEASGLPDTVQVSEAVRQRLRDRFAFESRGLLELKGKGRVPTYLLRGRLDAQPAVHTEAPGRVT